MCTNCLEKLPTCTRKKIICVNMYRPVLHLQQTVYSQKVFYLQERIYSKVAGSFTKILAHTNQSYIYVPKS